MKVILDHVDTEAANIKTLWFMPQRPIDYIPGQFVQLTLRHNQPDNRGEKRWFTLSSAPGQSMVSITTKYAGSDKSSSFKKSLFELPIGTELDMSEPIGDFVLPKDTSIPLVFVAGGIGLTPFHSMCEWLINQNERRPITLIYGVHSENEIVFRDTFTHAGIHTTFVVSKPSEEWGG